MKLNIDEEIVLFRSGSVVSSLLGAFGSSLRETRLTSLLGFLISCVPEEFGNFFGVDNTVLEVMLETHHSSSKEPGRSDIILKTKRGNIVIEAKVGYHNPLRQSQKYPAYKRILLTNHIPSISDRKYRNIKYVNWNQLAKFLQSLAKRKTSYLKFLCNDIIKYLETHSMIKKKESVEIYAREINNEYTLNFFLKARMYGCYFEKSSKLSEALYFSPHFGISIARNHPGVTSGISYIAKIEHIEVVESWKDFIAAVKDIRGKAWLNSHTQYLDVIHREWNWKDKKLRSMLFLGEPRLVFNPAVKKENLQKGKGWLSKRMFSFDELFAGWSK
jgi:hypothetical protein